MQTYINPDKSLWPSLCKRADASNDAKIASIVEDIVSQVIADGDDAVRRIARQIDKVELEDLAVSDAEFEEAAALVSDDLKLAIDNAYSNIYAFHKAQLPSKIEIETSPGVKCIQKPVPIRRVGLYIPGGTAPLFSTVLMLAIPALVSGCPTRILCTPCNAEGKVAAAVLYAASKCQVTAVYKIGGAQAIASMAYGTATVPKVDKIFGPGNRFVTLAKQLVASRCTAIDMPAGPSEVMVVADSKANPAFVASDLLSQAEHGRDSQALLVSTDKDFAAKVTEEIARQSKCLKRGEFISSSLQYSRSIVFDSLDEVVDFANAYAPEHLILSMENADNIAERIYAAGSVFIGPWSPESAGDYASGTNHTLPTSAWAHSYSGVNIDSFMRKMTLQKLSREGLDRLGKTIIAMADAEGLDAHANAVKVRLEQSTR